MCDFMLAKYSWSPVMLNGGEDLQWWVYSDITRYQNIEIRYKYKTITSVNVLGIWLVGIKEPAVVLGDKFFHSSSVPHSKLPSRMKLFTSVEPGLLHWRQSVKRWFCSIHGLFQASMALKMYLCSRWTSEYEGHALRHLPTTNQDNMAASTLTTATSKSVQVMSIWLTVSCLHNTTTVQQMQADVASHTC